MVLIMDTLCQLGPKLIGIRFSSLVKLQLQLSVFVLISVWIKFCSWILREEHPKYSTIKVDDTTTNELSGIFHLETILKHLINVLTWIKNIRTRHGSVQWIFYEKKLNHWQFSVVGSNIHFSKCNCSIRINRLMFMEQFILISKFSIYFRNTGLNG